MADRYLTLKDMTRGSGCTARTVRYYERQGLLQAARSAGGHRQFELAQLERLSFIISLREAGWALDQIETFLSARGGANTDREAVSRLDGMLAAHVDNLTRKIEVLTRLRADLEGTQSLLQVCGGCTTSGDAVECERCDRVPPLGRLPHGFRLTWRARELHADPDRPFDDAAADELGDETPDEGRLRGRAVTRDG